MPEAVVPLMAGVGAEMVPVPEVMTVAEAMVPEVSVSTELVMPEAPVPKMPVEMAGHDHCSGYDDDVGTLESMVYPKTRMMAEVMTEIRPEMTPGIVRANASMRTPDLKNYHSAMRLSEAGCEKEQRGSKQKGRYKTARVHIDLRRCDRSQLETCTARMEFRGRLPASFYVSRTRSRSSYKHEPARAGLSIRVIDFLRVINFRSARR
jgi:hypothetical protein